MRSTAMTDEDQLKAGKEKYAELLVEIQSLENQGTAEERQQVIKLKKETLNKIEEIDRLLVMIALEPTLDLDQIIKDMEKARGAGYGQDLLPILKAYLQTKKDTLESYAEHRQNDIGKDLVAMILFELVRDAEKYFAIFHPHYEQPKSYVSYEKKMFKLAVGNALDKDPSKVTAADEKKARKNAANVVGFFANIRSNHPPAQPQVQSRTIKRP